MLSRLVRRQFSTINKTINDNARYAWNVHETADGTFILYNDITGKTMIIDKDLKVSQIPHTTEVVGC